MDEEKFFKSITQELNAVKDRVQHLIGTKHWPTVGQWKESALRSVLRRHLPKNVQIGTGFIIDGEEESTQIDILLYDAEAPILFQDGDLVLIRPDAVRGVIEVKSSLQPSAIENVSNKLANIAEFVRKRTKSKPAPIFGLFAYEAQGTTGPKVARGLAKVCHEEANRIVSMLSLGDCDFVEYAAYPPNQSIPGWRVYRLPDTAPAFFVCRIIGAVCRNDPNKFIGYSWVSLAGKERYYTETIPFYEGTKAGDSGDGNTRK